MQKESNTDRGVLYGWKEIAQYIGCSPKTARAYSKRQQLPVKKVEGRVLLSKKMVEQWLIKK